ncbi:MAG: glycoside hydrolase family 3 protein [Butyrivibrio sp.]|nr:glycoside hydrolase family 3 protein [Butyrivibrio sp.]
MSKKIEQDFDEKRLERRQRRKRNQITAYSILAVILMFITASVFSCIYSLNKVFGKTKDEQGIEAAEEGSSKEVVIESPGAVEEEEYLVSNDELLDGIVDTCIKDMSLEDKVAGLFIVTPEQLTGVSTAVKAGSGTKDALMKYAVGGLVYFSKNIKNEEQITEMLDETSTMSKYPVFTLVAEDGSKSGAISSKINIENVATVTDSDSAHTTAMAVGNAMYKYGFNFNISPAIAYSSKTSDDAELEKAKDIAVSFSEGLIESGMVSCFDSFPSKVDASADKTEVDKSADDLEAAEYKVFKEAIANDSVNAIMVSAASYPNVENDNSPACLSKTMITDQLRGHLGFGGIVLTDSLSSPAVTKNYKSDEAAVAAIQAGADMIYLPENFEEAYNGVLKAVKDGTITEDRINESLRRIYKIKYAGRMDVIQENNDSSDEPAQDAASEEASDTSSEAADT